MAGASRALKRGTSPRASETQLDISTFFKNRKDLHKLFPKHWKGTAKKHQKRFETLLQRIRAELLDLVEERAHKVRIKS